jgi:hypothetical protein
LVKVVMVDRVQFLEAALVEADLEEMDLLR